MEIVPEIWREFFTRMSWSTVIFVSICEYAHGYKNSFIYASSDNFVYGFRTV
jgi:hypothetical protein